MENLKLNKETNYKNVAYRNNIALENTYTYAIRQRLLRIRERWLISAP